MMEVLKLSIHIYNTHASTRVFRVYLQYFMSVLEHSVSIIHVPVLEPSVSIIHVSVLEP